MGVKCELILNKDTIFAGETLSGKVTYTFDSTEIFEEIFLQVLGSARFDYASGKYKIPSVEDFLDYTSTIYGGRRQNTEMQRGTYSSLFQYKIPLKSPSSFKESQSSHVPSIKYRVKVMRLTTFATHEDAEVKFIVANYINLNNYPKARDGEEITTLKDTFWCCCKTTPFISSLQIPRKGFVPGDKIPFLLECNNQTGYIAEKITVSLRINFLLYTDKSVKRNRVNPPLNGYVDSKELILSECILGLLRPHKRNSWNNYLDIPMIQPHSSEGCATVKIEYCVCAEVKFPSPHVGLQTRIPIYLGNISIGQQSSAEVQSTTFRDIPFKVIYNLSEIRNDRITRISPNALI